MIDIDSKTRLVTLLGYPLGHSLSPLIHNAAFQAQGINMVYLCMPVAPEYFRQAADGLGRAGWVGSNVTIPHKQRAYELADELSEQAKAVRAVNTLVLTHTEGLERPRIYGDNTDIKGFADTLIPYKEQLYGEDVVVLGSGGSARAIVYALLSYFQPSMLTIAARSVSKAEQVVREMAEYDTRGVLRITDLTNSSAAIKRSVLLVNTTPVGMHPKTAIAPIKDFSSLSKGQVVYDLIYNPINTVLLEEAEQRGATTLSGLEMLIRQAAASYVQWTGKEMPLDTVRDVVKKHLG